jgi:hypothetical protein
VMRLRGWFKPATGFRDGRIPAHQRPDEKRHISRRSENVYPEEIEDLLPGPTS